MMTPTLMYVNAAACAVIFSWSTWCVFCRRVNDGLFGKLIFCMISLSSLALMLGHGYDYANPHRIAVTLNVSFALLGIRHVMVKYAWPKFQRAMRCANCPNEETR